MTIAATTSAIGTRARGAIAGTTAWSHPAVGARRPTGVTRVAHAVLVIHAIHVTRGPAASATAATSGAVPVPVAGAVGEATTVARGAGSASAGGVTASSAASAHGPSA